MSKLSISEVDRRIQSMFSSAKLYKSPSKSLQLVYGALALELNSRTPSGKRRNSVFLANYAYGYYMALSNQLWQNELEFCYVVEGVIYSTHKNSCHGLADQFYSKGSAFMDSLGRGHYWKNSSNLFA